MGNEHGHQSNGTSEQLSNSPHSTLSTDGIFDLLKNQHRRAILFHFKHSDRNRISVESLHNDLTINDSKIPQKDLAAIDLHLHLLRIADAGVIRYNTDTQMIQYLPQDRLEHIMGTILKEL